ncbi:flavodoxin family protein [Georgenia thermotolerans]|uniref:Flavodoxin n=1 Tax=Georgenia thermotolerans TaxID=527326 RepID=A0A7J5UML7_9MICO|nr:flavodoxin domain-containing protein [Georgenia thermotolerans]KAE8763520.1 flavodoxin [Georgenia thermotolerans]
MRALVVYESMFGNTQEVARAVAAGLRPSLEVELCEVGRAPALADLDVDLLVVGAPTHAFGLSRAGTREDAATRGEGPVLSAGTGVREWLDAAAPVRGGLAVAAFDTHVRSPRVPGRASVAAQRRLRHLGARIACPAESFWVHGYTGPLLDGELDRARRWGEVLGARVAGALAT